MSDVDSRTSELPEELLSESFALFLLEKWKISSGESRGELYSFKERPFLYDVALDTFQKVVVQKSAQCGITELMVAWAVWKAIYKKGNILYGFPALQQLRQLVGGRVRPSIEDNTFVASKISGVMNLEQIQIGGNTLYFRGVMNRRQMISVDVSTLLVDELDTAVLEANSNDFGNVVYTLEKRLGAASHPQMRYFSTPSYPGMGISAEYAGDDTNPGSDQRVWMVRCPKCRKEQQILWDENIVDLNEDKRGRSEYAPDARRICTGCHIELNPDTVVSGKYVPLKPQLSKTCHGYQVSKLMLANPNLNQMWLDSLNALKEQEFRCSDLGVPFEPKGSKITDELLELARNSSNHAILYQSDDPTFMGVDLGKVHHVVIGAETPDRQIKVVWAGECKDYTELERIMKRYNVRFGVMDAQPEMLKSKEFCAAHAGRMMAAYYPTYLETTKDTNKDKDDIIIHINRSLVMSMVIQAFFDNRVLLPKDIRNVKDFYKMMKAPIKAMQEDTNGNMRTFFPPTKVADHYFHAFVYLMIALEKRPRDVIFLPRGLFR
jgi:hypothetical protein